MNRFIREAYKHAWQGTVVKPALVADILVYPQRNNWACGPWSLRHCFMKWGIDVDPYQIAKLALSTRAGTDERRMELGAFRLGARWSNKTVTSALAAKRLIQKSLRKGNSVVLSVDNDEHWIAVLHHGHKGYLIFDSSRPGPVIQLHGWKWVKRRLRTREGKYGVAPVQRPR
jgi:hypothetical protein